ncbi:HAD-IIIA family hydrolase [bacterium]|nr:HAD-IIIA family hydrolase [bacterium]MBU1918037.1 HAD-IIIA family hydrolase [bacterium]
MIKIIGFDIDDTLISKRLFSYCCFKAIALDVALKTKKNKKDILLSFMKEFDELNRTDTIGAVLRHYNIYSKTLLNKLVQQYRNANAKKAVYPDTIKTLTTLKKQGYTIVAITDGKATAQKQKLIQTGLQKHFDHIIVADGSVNNNKKPNMSAFLKIFKKYKLHPHQFLYIGDNPYRDFVNLKTAGAHTLRINRSDGQFKDISLSKKYEAHASLPDLESLSNIVKNITGDNE